MLVEIKEGDRGFHFFFLIRKKKTKPLIWEKNREIETSDDFVDRKTRYVRILLKSPFTEFLYIKKSMSHSQV